MLLIDVQNVSSEQFRGLSINRTKFLSVVFRTVNTQPPELAEKTEARF